MKNFKLGLMSALASMFGNASASLNAVAGRDPREAYPDRKLPRPAHVQADLIARAQEKRELRAKRFTTKVLEGKFDKNGNPRTIIQQIGVAFKK